MSEANADTPISETDVISLVCPVCEWTSPEFFSIATSWEKQIVAYKKHYGGSHSPTPFVRRGDEVLPIQIPRQ